MEEAVALVGELFNGQCCDNGTFNLIFIPLVYLKVILNTKSFKSPFVHSHIFETSAIAFTLQIAHGFSEYSEDKCQRF